MRGCDGGFIRRALTVHGDFLQTYSPAVLMTDAVCSRGAKLQRDLLYKQRNIKHNGSPVK